VCVCNYLLIYVHVSLWFSPQAVSVWCMCPTLRDSGLFYSPALHWWQIYSIVFLQIHAVTVIWWYIQAFVRLHEWEDRRFSERWKERNSGRGEQAHLLFSPRCQETLEVTMESRLRQTALKVPVRQYFMNSRTYSEEKAKPYHCTCAVTATLAKPYHCTCAVTATLCLCSYKQFLWLTGIKT